MLNNELRNVLNQLDSVLLERGLSEPCGLLSGGGGAGIYFFERFKGTGNHDLLEASFQILEKEINAVNNLPQGSYYSIGSQSASPFFLINEFVKAEILEAQELLGAKQFISLVYECTTQDEFRINKHDLFYGFIGKAVLLIAFNETTALPFVEKVNCELLRQSKTDRFGGYWLTPEPLFKGAGEPAVNTGVPHGMVGIILYLLKCKRIYGLAQDQEMMLFESVKWIVNRLNESENQLLYSYSQVPSGSGMLGWCYGQLSIIYMLLSFDAVYPSSDVRKKIDELLLKAVSTPIEKSGVRYSPKEDAFDVCLCHGASSVCYMYKKIYALTNDHQALQQVNLWLNFLVSNLEKQINSVNAKNGNKENKDVSGFLNGLSGAGLVLADCVSGHQGNCWEKLLLLE